ncbi:MAG TPA: MBG domain-containing protein, partial [Verrucomicrobiae bacterium]
DGIKKYSLVGGSWVANATYPDVTGFGLCAGVNGSGGAVLYLTTGTGATAANSVIALTDTAGYNANITIVTANNVSLYTAATGTTLKGIAFAPALLAPTLTVANSPVTYNGSAQAATINTSVTGTLSNVKYNGSTALPTAAGSYVVTADFTPDDTVNYRSVTGASAGSFVINKAASAITLTGNTTFLYDGGAKTPAFAFTGSGGAAAYSYVGSSYGPTADAPTNAGNYSVQVVLTTDLNYLSATNTQAFTINPLTLNVTAIATNKTYGTVDPFLSYTYSPALVVGDSFSGALTRVAGETVGDYAIGQGTLALSANYSLNYIGANLTVDPAALTITASNISKSYGQTVTFAGSEFNVLGLVPGDQVTSVLLSSVGTTNTVAPGSYGILAEGATGNGLGNYTITYHGGLLTVNPALLLVSADNQARVYGVTNPVLTASFSGFVNGETLLTSDVGGAPLLTTTADTNSPVGSYDIVAAAGTLTATNYTFIFSNGMLNVAQAAITVTAQNESRGYGEVNPAFTASYSGFVNGEGTNVLSGVPSLTTSADSQSPTGTYPILAGLGTLTSTNYAFNFVAGTLTVVPVSLVITA